MVAACFNLLPVPRGWRCRDPVHAVGPQSGQVVLRRQMGGIAPAAGCLSQRVIQAAIDLGFVPNGRPSMYRMSADGETPRQGTLSGSPVRTEATTSWIARVTAAA